MAPVTLENKMGELIDKLNQIDDIYRVVVKESENVERKIEKQSKIISSLLETVKEMTHEQAYDILDSIDDVGDFERMYITLSQKIHKLEEPETIFQILVNNHQIVAPKRWFPANSFVEKYGLNNQYRYWLGLVDRIKVEPNYYDIGTTRNNIKALLDYMGNLSFGSRRAYVARRIFFAVGSNIKLLENKPFFDVVCKKLDQFSLDRDGKDIYEDYKWLKNVYQDYKWLKNVYQG